MSMRLTSRVVNDPDPDDIDFLVIESDENDSGGFFLFGHRSLDEPCEWDLWFASLEDAKMQATSYGVAESDWIETADQADHP